MGRARRYAAYVLAERIDGRIVGQVYTSLPPAERKVARAKARGLRATITLVELVPVGIGLEIERLERPKAQARQGLRHDLHPTSGPAGPDVSLVVMG